MPLATSSSSRNRRQPISSTVHQRARATLADQELEAALRAHLLPGEVPGMQHYIAER